MVNIAKKVHTTKIVNDQTVNNEMVCSDFVNSFERLEHWLTKNNFEGYEPKDVYSAEIFIQLRSKFKDPLKAITRKESSGKINSGMRLALSPFYQTKTAQLLLRKLLLIKKGKDPKAYSMFARAYINLYKKTQSERAKKRVFEILDWLMEHRSPGYENYCWGYDFAWPHSPTSVWPKYTPQSTMVTYIGNIFLEAYYLFGEEKFKQVALSCGDFCLHDLNIDSVNEDTICFSYSPLDHDHVINVNAHVGALLARLYKLTDKKEYYFTAIKAFNFVKNNQNENGSWFYRAPPEKYLGPADNYHTGDILEYLFTFMEETADTRYVSCFNKGLDYYVTHFFLEDGTPKMSDYFVYPVDIHSSAQSIVSLSMIREHKSFKKKVGLLPEKIALWTIQNMQHPTGYFIHRIYKNGIKVKDKMAFLRWGQGEMLAALSFLV